MAQKKPPSRRAVGRLDKRHPELDRLAEPLRSKAIAQATELIVHGADEQTAVDLAVKQALEWERSRAPGGQPSGNGA
jgi:hypothetical protein